MNKDMLMTSLQNLFFNTKNDSLMEMLLRNEPPTSLMFSYLLILNYYKLLKSEFMFKNSI